MSEVHDDFIRLIKSCKNSEMVEDYQVFRSGSKAVFFVLLTTSSTFDFDARIFSLKEKYPECVFFGYINSHGVFYKRWFPNTKAFIKADPIYSTKNMSLMRPVLASASVKELESLFFALHSIIRDVDGLHADVALDELCKLISVKINTELDNVDLFELEYACDDELVAEVNYYSLKTSIDKEPGSVGEVIFLSTQCIAKVVEKIKGVHFSSLSKDIKGRLFQNLISPLIRAGMGQYFTPKEVINFIVKTIQPLAHERIIDPFCGSAHFLVEAYNSYSSSVVDRKCAGLFGIEKNAKMHRLASLDSLLMDEYISVEHNDALASFGSFRDIRSNFYDVVMTNPPFGSLVDVSSLYFNKEFQLADSKKALPLEVLGLERSIQLLRDNGRMAIVLPDSIFYNKKNSYVREWLSSNVVVKGVVSLPISTFSPFGANVKTSILYLVKTRKKRKDRRVFIGKIESIGYDAAGRSVDVSDVDVVSDEFIKFIGKEGWE
jgi:type I restriction enzyme M protein